MSKVADRLSIHKLTPEELALCYQERFATRKARDYLIAAEKRGREEGRQKGIEKGRKENREEGRQEGDVAPKNRSSINERFVLKLNLNHNMNHEEKIYRRTNHQAYPRRGRRLNRPGIMS